MYNHNKAQQSKNGVHISWDILYCACRVQIDLNDYLFVYSMKHSFDIKFFNKPWTLLHVIFGWGISSIFRNPWWVLCVCYVHENKIKCLMTHGWTSHYTDVIMGSVASQITSLTIVFSAIYPGADQRKHQSSASLAFVWGIHPWPVNSPHKWPVTRKIFPFDDVIMLLKSFLGFLLSAISADQI